MGNISEYNISFDIAALALSLVVLVYYKLKKKLVTEHTKWFEVLLWLSSLTALFDIFTVFGYEFNELVLLNNIINTIYLLLFGSIPYVYYIYYGSGLRLRSEMGLINKFLSFVPIMIEYIFVVLSPATGLVFYFDENGEYHHGSCFIVLYVVASIYLLATLVLAIKYRNTLSKGTRVVVYCYNIACLIAILLQFVMPKQLLLQFVLSLAVLLVYLSLENPKDEEDKQIGAYNRNAFIKLVTESFKQDKHFYLIGVQMFGYHELRETLGNESDNAIKRTIIDKLISKNKRLKVFSLDNDKLAIYTLEDDSNIEDITEEIKEAFSKTFRYNQIDVKVSTNICYIDCPDDIDNVDEALDLIEFLSTTYTGKEGADGIVVRASDELVSLRRREAKILSIMRKSIDNDLFEVYYQPIYSVKEDNYHSAEALIRLRDPELGFISPEEFIPMAEKNGMIVSIGEQVFRKVCKMISEEKIWEKGISFIEVNLSAVQCMEERLHDKLFGIMDEYGVPYECINLEITETATVVSKEVLWNNMQQFIDDSIFFSLDDYGMGYSNLSNVIKYPFNIIKIDKSMIWMAEHDERALKALEHTIAMVKDMDMSIVAEGVETKELVELLEKLGCDYFQGFYFSRPVPQDEFLKLLVEKNEMAKNSLE